MFVSVKLIETSIIKETKVSKPIIGQKVLGNFNIGKKDAFHVASIVANSRSIVKPGDHVRFYSDGFRVEVCDQKVSQGIVDPFLPVGDIYPLELFWVLMHPDHVKNLTHQFEVFNPDEEEDFRLYDDDNDYPEEDCC